MSASFFKQFADPSRSQAALSSSDISSSPSMSSRKRSRNPDDVDGDVEIESASSSFRQTQNPKRSRVALAAERGGSTVSDDDDEFDDPTQNGAYDDHATRSSTMLEDEDDEIDELAATQIVERQIREHRDNLASEQGVIEEVFCRNFMCHSKLRIKLGPLINFIIGHNGSGKSAVLTALTMCLGGKATATNRGASLKSLIKEGEESAALAVKIKNQGDGAYKPELYGRSIIVERHFSRSGTSGFKLKNAQEKTISTKKAHLDDILDFFAFQLDNPINVLTQDMARQFLSNSTPTDKYKFFIRGTQLEILDNDYKILEEHLDNMEVKLHAREDDVKKLKANAEEAERKKKRLDKTEKLQEQVQRIQYMHAWAQVEEQEEILQRYQRDVDAGEQNVQEKVEAFESVSATYEGHNQAFEAAQRQAAQLKEQQAPLEQERDEAKTRFDANTDSLRELNGEERMIRGDVKRLKENVKRLETEVTNENGRLAGAEGEAHQGRVARLAELKAAVDEIKTAQMQHGTGIADLENAKRAAYEAYEAAKPPVDERKNTLKDAEGHLQRLQSNQPRPFAAYVPHMEQLVRAVNAETRWRTKPVGPMGMHIKLLKPEWSSAIEKTFGGSLGSFVVTCLEDQRMLVQLAKRVNCPANILIGDPTPLDTSAGEPDPNLDTILRVLEIDNDLVRNQLIINQAIDQTALIPDRQRATDLMYNSGGRPRNIKTAMSFVSDVGKAVRLEFTRTGQPKTSNVEKWTGPARMKTNHEEQIRIQREAVNHAKRDFDAAQQDIRRLQMALKEASEAINRFEKEQRTLKTRLNKAEDDVDAQQGDIDQNQPQNGRLQELERQLAEAKDEAETSSNSFMDMVNAKTRLGETGKELGDKLLAVQATLKRSEDQVKRAEERVDQLTRERTVALREKNAADQAIEDARKEVTRLEEKRDRQQRRVDEEFVPGATKICQRINVEEGMTAELLDKRLERLSNDIEQAQRQAGGTREELVQAYRQAKTAFDEAQDQMNVMSTCAKVCCLWRLPSAVLSMLTLLPGSQEVAQQTKGSMGEVPQIHRSSPAHHLLLPAQRAPIPRPGPDGPRQQSP